MKFLQNKLLFFEDVSFKLLNSSFKPVNKDGFYQEVEHHFKRDVVHGWALPDIYLLILCTK